MQTARPGMVGAVPGEHAFRAPGVGHPEVPGVGERAERLHRAGVDDARTDQHPNPSVVLRDVECHHDEIVARLNTWCGTIPPGRASWRVTGVRIQAVRYDPPPCRAATSISTRSSTLSAKAPCPTMSTPPD